VVGNGYTNHCPRCLWSQHVDVHPGDRASPCRAPMRPIGVDYARDEFVVVHQCARCGVVRRNRAAADDDLSTMWS
jgi:hypothetical protein